MPDIPVGTALTIFGAAVGCWAWVVGWAASVIRREVADLKKHVEAFATTQAAHVTQTERRLTMLETEFAYIKAAVYRGKHESGD